MHVRSIGTSLSLAILGIGLLVSVGDAAKPVFVGGDHMAVAGASDEYPHDAVTNPGGSAGALDAAGNPTFTDFWWRSSAAEGGTDKPLDIDGDNRYGTDGFVFFTYNLDGWSSILGAGPDGEEGTADDGSYSLDAGAVVDGVLQKDTLPSYIASHTTPVSGWGGGSDDIANRGFIEDPEFPGFPIKAGSGVFGRDIEDWVDGAERPFGVRRDCPDEGAEVQDGVNVCFDPETGEQWHPYGDRGEENNILGGHISQRFVIERADGSAFRLGIQQSGIHSQIWSEEIDVTIGPLADPDNPQYGSDSPFVAGVDMPDSNTGILHPVIPNDSVEDGGVDGSGARQSYFLFDIPEATDFENEKYITIIASHEVHDHPQFGMVFFDTGEAAVDCLDGVGCARSDINMNGSVDFADFVILSTDFGKSSPHAAGGVANIPEPTGIVILVTGGLALLLRRRR